MFYKTAKKVQQWLHVFRPGFADLSLAKLVLPDNVVFVVALMGLLLWAALVPDGAHKLDLNVRHKKSSEHRCEPPMYM